MATKQNSLLVDCIYEESTLEIKLITLLFPYSFFLFDSWILFVPSIIPSIPTPCYSLLFPQLFPGTALYDLSTPNSYLFYHCSFVFLNIDYSLSISRSTSTFFIYIKSEGKKKSKKEEGKKTHYPRYDLRF